MPILIGKKMVALSKEISGEILSWENSSHIDVIAKNILTQVNLLTNGKFPDNNICLTQMLRI